VALSLPETLTLATAAQTLRTLQPALKGVRVEVDASALRDFDSAALAVLLQLRRDAQAGGGDIVIQRPPAPLVELAHLYGLDAALPGLEAEPASAPSAPAPAAVA
jgi:phospholipid transport system transporter-binding protein